VAPFFLPYVRVKADFGFARDLEDAAMFSADWQAWLASSAWAHRWMLPWLERWNEVLFPGFLLPVLGVTGLIIGLRRWRGALTPANGSATAARVFDAPVSGYLTTNRRETTAFYGLIGAIAFWASFGPDAGLYALLYHTIPVFTFLRAPGRFGIMVVLALGVLSLVALRALLANKPWRTHVAVGSLLAMLVGAEFYTAPISLQDASTPAPQHRRLAHLPDGALIEMPFWYERSDYPRHARYMLWSTYHWKPMVNGYSDHIPQWFRDQAVPLSSFPTRDSFDLLRPHDVRYALFHLRWYAGNSRVRLMERLEQYAEYLRPIDTEGEIWLFEIIDYPR
jgi:hypothetical protein